MLMIPKELIEKQRKAEDLVNRTHTKYMATYGEFIAAVEKLRQIQSEIGEILGTHAAQAPDNEEAKDTQ